MQTKLTIRHGDIPEALKARAASIMERLARLAMRPTSAHVTFGNDHQRATVEIVLNAARGAVHVAGAEGPDPRTALDRASAKLRRQLDKHTTAPRRRARKTAAR